MIRPVGRGLAAALLVAAAACSSDEQTADTTVATAPGRAATVAEALTFEAPTVGGGRFIGADYAGRTVALWFWAPY